MNQVYVLKIREMGEEDSVYIFDRFPSKERNARQLSGIALFALTWFCRHIDIEDEEFEGLLRLKDSIQEITPDYEDSRKKVHAVHDYFEDKEVGYMEIMEDTTRFGTEFEETAIVWDWPRDNLI
tara:strand:+ start:4053 stop:4424 length:372 start_codon:yes stop_codon:yes gene_type:complete